MEDIAGRFSLIGFYVSPRELIWLTGAVAAEALLTGVAVSAGFSLPTLLLLAVPALSCWAALKLRVDGAVIERWLMDMALFIARGRVLAIGRHRPDFRCRPIAHPSRLRNRQSGPFAAPRAPF